MMYLLVVRKSLRQITEYAASRSFAVVGGRRIGKTSVLTQLHRLRLPSAGFYAVFHDCSSTPTFQDFMDSPLQSCLPEPLVDVRSLGDLWKVALSGKPIVLLLDEADKLVVADQEAHPKWKLFGALRWLVNSGRVQLVLSGEKSLRSAMLDPTSPLFNLVNEILLRPLDYISLKELVTRPMRLMEIELSDEQLIVQQIFEFTSGHPNVAQRLCHRLIEHLTDEEKRRITPDDVNTIVNMPAFQRVDFLGTFWEAASPLEKIISLLMTNDTSVRTLDSVHQALALRCQLSPKVREVDESLQRLVDLRSILRATQTGYEFAVTAFPKVVAGSMVSTDLISRFVDEYRERVE